MSLWKVAASTPAMGQAIKPIQNPASSPTRTLSDQEPGIGPDIDPKIVMAEQSTHDVVDQASSVGDASLADNHATQPTTVNHTEGGVEGEKTPNTNIASSAVPASDSQAQELPSQSTGDEAQVDQAKRSEVSQATEPDTGKPANDAPAPPPATGAPHNEQDGTRDGTQDDPSINLEPGTDQAVIAEASGGSDTDSSKIDPAKGHLRTNSVKKPASFKAVSVTKNFLAKAAAGSIPSLKLGGDKGSPHSPISPNNPQHHTDGTAAATASGSGQAISANQPPARPRLVAKTGSGLRDAGPRLSTTPTPGKALTPDASQVWNKNRRKRM
jgi:hypothetical protein